MSSPIRVLVVDDSALMRKMVCDMLSQDPAILVVGHARDGQDALSKMATLVPDVITMDVEMPLMDGVAALTEIMAKCPTPVIMVSSLTQKGAETTMTCLRLGAVDFIAKPSGSISLDLPKVREELIQKVKAAARAKKSLYQPQPPIRAAAPMPTVGVVTSKSSSKDGMLLIGSSTGGPRALHTLIPSLPADLNIPVVVVQHLPEIFTTMLASKLNEESPFEVREAKPGDTLRAGTILIAPGGKHLQFDKRGVAELTDAPTVHGVRPSIDITMASLIPIYREKLIAVLLTGMGRDGAAGMKGVHDLGGQTIAEHESTCVVYGMPKTAVDMGAASQVLPLPEIADAIKEVVAARRSSQLKEAG